MLIEYQFYNNDGQFIGNLSSGVLRNTLYIPDITLPKFTRSIVSMIYSIFGVMINKKKKKKSPRKYHFMDQELIRYVIRIFILVFMFIVLLRH
jgi:hypothetical protein